MQPIQGRRRAGDIDPLFFWKGTMVAEVLLHNCIIGDVMVYQDRLETNLLLLFKHTKNSECVFSQCLLLLFYVNIAAEQKQITGNDLL